MGNPPTETQGKQQGDLHWHFKTLRFGLLLMNCLGLRTEEQYVGLGATQHPGSSRPYLQKASLQQEHLVCIGGGPSEETLHSSCLPKPATQMLTPGPGG